MTSAISIPDSANVVEIDWYDDSEQVVVRPRKQSRFTIQKDRAIEALRAANEVEKFTKQFNLLLEVLGGWIKAHTAGISVAVVTLHDNSLAFVVVQRNPSYDERFQDEISNLEFSIAHDADLSLIKMRTVLLPPVGQDDMRSFLDERMILTYHHGQRT